MQESLGVAGRNRKAFFLSTLMYTLGVSFLAEGYIQAYLLEIGLDMQAIGLYGTITNIAALAGYISYSRVRVRDTRDAIRIIIVCAIVMCVMPPALVLSGFVPKPLIVICAGAAMYQLFMAFKTACEYSTVPLLFPRGDYGPVTAKSGMLGSLAAAVISILSGLPLAMDTKTKYLGFFAAAFLGYTVSAFMTTRYRPCAELSAKEEGSGEGPAARPPLKRALWLLLPHFLRGVASGVFYYFVPIALGRVTLSSIGQTIFVSIGVLGAVAACWLFMRLQERFRTGVLIFFGNLFSSIAIIIVCFVNTQWGFFAAYALHSVAGNITGYSVPAGVINTIPVRELPWLSSIRMFTLSAATCVLIAPVASCLEVFPVLAVAGFGAAVYVLDGFVFRAQLTDELKDR